MHCPICHAKQTRGEPRVLHYPTGKALFADCKIYTCENCLGGWVPNPPSPEALQEYYERGAYGEDGILDFGTMFYKRCQAVSRWEYLKDALKGFRGIGGKPFSLCDIGAGYATTYEVAKCLGLRPDYFAFENFPAMCRRIKALGGHLLGNFLSDSLDRQFDMVWACHILEHYPDPDTFFKRVDQLLNPGGIGLIETPCLDFEFKEDLGEHLLFFSVEGMQRAIKRNAFTLLTMDTLGPKRREARSIFAIDSSSGETLKSHWLKKRVPRGLVNWVRLTQAVFKERLFKRGLVLEEVKQSPTFRKWELDQYGEGRIWIRAVFVKPDNILVENEFQENSGGGMGFLGGVPFGEVP